MSVLALSIADYKKQVYLDVSHVTSAIISHQKRLSFANGYNSWTAAQWGRVLFFLVGEAIIHQGTSVILSGTRVPVLVSADTRSRRPILLYLFLPLKCCSKSRKGWERSRIEPVTCRWIGERPTHWTTSVQQCAECEEVPRERKEERVREKGNCKRC